MKKNIKKITKSFNVISNDGYIQTRTNEFDNKIVSSWEETFARYHIEIHKKTKNYQNYINSFMNGYFFGGQNYTVGAHTYYGNEFAWLEEDNDKKIGYELNKSPESKIKSKELMGKAYHKATVIDIFKIIDDFNDRMFTD